MIKFKKFDAIEMCQPEESWLKDPPKKESPVWLLNSV